MHQWLTRVYYKTGKLAAGREEQGLRDWSCLSVVQFLTGGFLQLFLLWGLLCHSTDGQSGTKDKRWQAQIELELLKLLNLNLKQNGKTKDIVNLNRCRWSSRSFHGCFVVQDPLPFVHPRVWAYGCASAINGRNMHLAVSLEICDGDLAGEWILANKLPVLVKYVTAPFLYRSCDTNIKTIHPAKIIEHNGSSFHVFCRDLSCWSALTSTEVVKLLLFCCIQSSSLYCGMKPLQRQLILKWSYILSGILLCPCILSKHWEHPVEMNWVCSSYPPKLSMHECVLTRPHVFAYMFRLPMRTEADYLPGR